MYTQKKCIFFFQGDLCLPEIGANGANMDLKISLSSFFLEPSLLNCEFCTKLEHMSRKIQ